MNNQCQCDLQADRITDGVFKCFPQSPQAVTYRAFMHGSINVTAFELILQLERWTAEEPSIVVQRVLMTVDKACVVTIPSFIDDECLLNNNSIQPPSKQPSESFATIIAGTTVAGGAVAAVIFGMSVLVIVHMCMVKQRRNR